jgi:hypothetical protein
MILLCYFGDCNVRYRSGALAASAVATLTLADCYCRLNQPKVTLGLVPWRPTLANLGYIPSQSA